ncbi:DNA binding domain-containing protein [Bacteroides uniformis]|uniref:DNA binding domain-containing protein n=1 Tax=Bacteroides uniformis TaxID=820 RepID=A0A174G067_BACUN|nr:helix-turn-helix domain-containing protein [Bacteroides uniformis]CUO54558.1 DNA binding domain-containing protein [Bacteroides uniformis]
MASSSIRIKKVCEWCGEVFYAQKTTTRYCSHRCNSKAYKEITRNKRIQDAETKTNILISQQPIQIIKDKEFLSFAEAGTLLGISRQAVYKMVAAGHLKASKISSRLSFIKRSDIENMLENKPYEKRNKKDIAPITEFYTTAEVKEKYNVVDSWIFVVAKKHNIPRTFNRGKTYWSKKHIDNYFGKKAADPEITEWYNVQEIQDKFGMSLAAIYTLASKNAVPKKKEGIMVSYSKKHFDIAKGIAQPDEPQYYTVAEAMAKFNLTRDQLYHYAKYHNIPRVKVGKYVKISRPELDKLFEAPKIE